MLFDSVFNKAKWRDKDPLWPVWKDHKEEINKWLKFIESKDQLKRYKSRLNSPRPKQRDETINEIMAAYIMETKLKYPVIHWEEKTISKDVDFVILNGDDNIYCEVKTLTWQSELTQKERLSGRKNLPKYINDAEGHWVAPLQNIRRALYKSIPKFLPNCMNLVILIPDLFYFPSINSKKSINLDIDFVNKDYENIGGILILKCKLRSFPSRIEYKHKFFANEYAKKPFSI